MTSGLRDSGLPLTLVAIGAGATTPLPDNVERVPATSMLPSNLGWSIDGLPRGARRAVFDVFHAPAYTAPLWGVHPLVVTIHDVSYERHPEWYPYRIDPVRRWFYRRSAVTADAVITDSLFSRREIAAVYGVPLERIHVVPLGVSAPFMAQAAPRQGTDDGGVNTAAQSLSGTTAGTAAGVDGGAHREPRRIVHVGDLHTRRNLLVIVDALAALRQRPSPACDAELLLIGVDRGAAASIRERAQSLGVLASVTFLPDASDAVIVSELRRAALLAYPSLYEGFGLPVLEAMACGTPVVASTAASIPEVVGDAGVLVEPSDVRGWVDAMASVLESAERARQLSAAGRRRASEFTWTRTAAGTAKVYESVRLKMSDGRLKT